MEYLVEQGTAYEQTSKAGSLLGKRVLSKSGSVIGKVKEVCLDSTHTTLQGVLVSRGLFSSSLYVSKEYINRLTNQAVLLSCDPAMLLRGLVVVSKDGKRFGKVADVIRQQETNKVVSFHVRRHLFWKYEVPASTVKKAHKTVLLDMSYEQAKSSFKKVT